MGYAERPISSRQYVVVTVAPGHRGDIVHVYTVGDKPTTRGKARALAKELERLDREHYPDAEERIRTFVREVIIDPETAQ